VTKIPVWASVKKYKRVKSKKVFKVAKVKRGKMSDEVPAWWGISKKE
jgi:hypothetical protein